MIKNESAVNAERYTKKTFKFDATSIDKINPFNTELLLNFISKRGLLLPRKLFNISEKYYSRIIRAIKTARTLYLLPF